MNPVKKRGGARRLAVIALSAALALGAAPVALSATGVTTVAAASAHDKAASLTCTLATVSLTNYDANATVKVTLDGTVLINGKVPRSGYFLNQTLDGKVNHSLTVKVHSYDGSQYNMDYSETTTNCVPVIPKDASASVTPKDNASCLGVSTVSFAINHATWDGPADLTVGTHTRSATAESGHKFGNGTTREVVTYTITDANPALCPHTAVATVSNDQTATCLVASTVKFDLLHASWDGPADLTVGTHTRAATAEKGFLFPNGTAHMSVTYTITDANPALCPHEATPVVPATTAAVCVGSTPTSASYTVPSTTGVTYMKDGKAIKADTYKVLAGDTVTLTAQPADATYVLKDASWSWTKTFPSINCAATLPFTGANMLTASGVPVFPLVALIALLLGGSAMGFGYYLRRRRAA